jgi:hypothetical protein
MTKGQIRTIGTACAIALLAVYLVTMAPSLTWAHNGADGGDLVTAVARGSIPHPPGSPTYLLLGDLFIRLPWGNPAWRLNLMSAILATAAAGLMTTAWFLMQRAEDNTRLLAPGPVVLTTGLCLGLAPLFWSQALITEVYALAAFFSALVVALALRGRPAWALGVAWGVGMGAHPTLLFLAPLVAWGALRDPGRRLRRLVGVLLSTLVGWGAMYGPVLLARKGAPSPWGDVSTLAGWWALVSGHLYRGYPFALPLGGWPQRFLAWAGLLARQFTPLGAVLAGLGIARLWHAERSLTIASVLAFGVFSLYAIGYNTTDSLVYLVPALLLAALWLAMGLAEVANWLNRRVRRGAWAILLLPLLQALLFWGQMNVSADEEAMAWAGQVLQQAPPQAILLTGQDNHTFTLWYAHDVLELRPDVTVIDRDLWGYGPYREMMMGILGLDAGEGTLEEIASRSGRPLEEVP